MQLSKINTGLLWIMVFAFFITGSVYAETKDGWKGYGLYDINGSKVSIISETVDIELQQDKAIFNGEFIIRNYSSSAIKGVMGTPALGIDKINIYEKNTGLKWKKRSLASLQNEFGIENKLPLEEYWYTFNVNLNPGETKLVTIKFEAALPQEDESRLLSYYGDRNLGYRNQAGKSSLFVDVVDFQPYNIIDSQGIDADLIGEKGDLIISHDDANPLPVSITYMDLTKSVLNKLNSSAMYKPKEIGASFASKNYTQASSLCDEYLLNPKDAGISEEEILFIKAESLRRLQNHDKYLSIVEALDYSKLYPEALKNKIYMDRMTIYFEQGNKERLMDLYKEMEGSSMKSTQFLKNFIEGSKVYGGSEIKSDSVFTQLSEEEKTSVSDKSRYQQWYETAMAYKYTPVIVFAAGLLLGLTVRGIRTKKKRKKSMYIYRM